VDELTDSTRLLGDGHALHARLAEDGYVFLRGLLPTDTVQTVRAGVGATLDDAGWLARSSTADAPIPTDAAVREGRPGYFDAYVGIQRLQSFHELAHHPAVLSVMDGIVGEPLLVHPRKIARTSLPHDDEYTPPHQDYRLIQGTVDTLTCWVPLGDCPATLGSLRMLQGSHLGGLADADPGKGPGGLQVEVDDDDKAWRTTDYRAGDAIIFTSLTVHGALRNNEDRLRFSADFRYQSLLEPVLKHSLDPHYFPQVPGWDELTRGWSSRRSVESPTGVITTDMVPPLDPTLQAPPSRLLALA
jgi:ectoine hydroxylase-related dioxygenase (phytanoyl-CoA dioxygenase family)